MANQIYHEKRYLKHHDGIRLAIYEVVVWKVPFSKKYPEGVKYRAWVSENGTTLVGFDNHPPKGHHMHLGQDTELPYLFLGYDHLLEDIESFIRKAGFIYEV